MPQSATSPLQALVVPQLPELINQTGQQLLLSGIEQPSIEPYNNEDIFIIDTNFDPAQNKSFKYSRYSHDEIYASTEEERKRAEKAFIPEDLNDLREKVKVRMSYMTRVLSDLSVTDGCTGEDRKADRPGFIY